jgi:hypothetical protein
MAGIIHMSIIRRQQRVSTTNPSPDPVTSLKIARSSRLEIILTRQERLEDSFRRFCKTQNSVIPCSLHDLMSSLGQDIAR